MVGVRPLPDALGRVNKIEPVPLEELGRPRIDVVVNCSGVFRDLFINQVDFYQIYLHDVVHTWMPFLRLSFG